MNIRLALLGLALAGCFSATQRREEDLIQSARMFNDDLRWARWDQMGSSMLPEERPLFLSRVDLVNNDLVMCDFEVKNIRFDTGSNAATVTVAIDWYSKRDPNLRNTTLEQRWETRKGNWVMVKQRRTHGERFPLVTESATEKADGASGPTGGRKE